MTSEAAAQDPNCVRRRAVVKIQYLLPNCSYLLHSQTGYAIDHAATDETHVYVSATGIQSPHMKLNNYHYDGSTTTDCPDDTLDVELKDAKAKIFVHSLIADVGQTVNESHP